MGGRERVPRDPEGRMPLVEHLRELRNRLIKSLIAVGAGIGVGFLFYEQVWAFLEAPYCAIPNEARPDSTRQCELIFTGVFDPFLVQLKVAALVGVVVACPVWLYQMWAFVTPALRGKERLYTYGFLGAAIPLFVSGAGLAYYIAELALRVMFSFSPEGAADYITITNYLTYMILIMLVFGAAFVLPLLVVLLNFIGVLPHSALAKWRRVIIFFAFVFAAVVTPGDPITMLVLGGCIVALFEAAELVAFLNDRRKRRSDPYGGLDDDQVSPLEEEHEPYGAPGSAEDATGPSAAR